MKPLPLHLDAHRGPAVPVIGSGHSGLCAHCARPGARFASTAPGALACALCFLAQHLERPRIDEEAVLIWLPEMDQRVLNVVTREMHLQLRALDEPLHDDARPRSHAPERVRIYHARMALRSRVAPAVARLGTDKPSVLSAAIRSLAPEWRTRQAERLGGLRLLPNGRFFENGADIYPAIVDAWCNALQAAEA